MIGHLWQKRTNLTGLKTIDVFTPQFFRHLWWSLASLLGCNTMQFLEKY
jgi:hypothetical protein